jgi:hypothetical protein
VALATLQEAARELAQIKRTPSRRHESGSQFNRVADVLSFTGTQRVGGSQLSTKLLLRQDCQGRPVAQQRPEAAVARGGLARRQPRLKPSALLWHR